MCVIDNFSGKLLRSLNYVDDVSLFSETNTHNHERNFDKIKKIKIVDSMNKLMAADFYSPHDVVYMSLRWADINIIRIMVN